VTLSCGEVSGEAIPMDCIFEFPFVIFYAGKASYGIKI
jgi:hypothetical protein